MSSHELATSSSEQARGTELDAVHDENGVDLSLVRYSLSLTPSQRLKAVENFMNAMSSVRVIQPESALDPSVSTAT